AAFTRIRDHQSRNALLVNKNRAKKGEMVLTPIGGGIEATEEGLRELQQLLGIERSVFEKESDLRFPLSGAKANEFRTWFLQRQLRETDPTREVVEELVDEEGLLAETDLGEFECEFVGYHTELEATTRTGQEGKMTLRLLEIFEARLKAEALAKLAERSTQPNATIRFVTDKEIQSGQTDDGMKIGRVSSALLNPKETIEPFV
ncbi:MAG: hypothetical protein AAB733_03835, partial [Patescibacteria group bacterium]